jgi:uncharacterized iron-regulated membrane protein
VVRTVVFWMHLTAGLFAGIVVFIMSLTGVALTYEKQMLAWADRRAADIAAPLPDTPRATLDTLVERVTLAVPDATITTITRRDDPQAPITVALSGGVTVLVHPYTGHVIGEAPQGLRSVFRTTTAWHRYLAGSGEYRAIGKAITGACNLAFLFLVLSGAYLWLPRRWSFKSVSAVIVPRWTHGTTKARDFNWHNALGFWSAVPLAIVVASATVISYPWASDLAYRVVGDTPPPRPAAPASTAANAQPRATAPVRVVDLDARWRAAEAQVESWQTIALRMPTHASAPLVFTIDAGYGGQPQYRGTLTVDAASGAVVKWETFDDQSVGRRFRSMLRFAHTGEFWGIPGQTVAGLVSAAACVLVWTGLALAWRRFRAWRERVASAREELREAA